MKSIKSDHQNMIFGIVLTLWSSLSSRVATCCCNFWVTYFLLLTVPHVDSSQMSSCGRSWTGV